MDGLTIRPARPGEAAMLAALVERAYAPYLPLLVRRPAPMDDDYAQRIADGQAFVAAVGDAMAALLILVAEPGVLLIENVAVDPGFQGAGVGRQMMRWSEEEAARRGLAEMRLYTNERMVRNVALYERLGYRETHRMEQDGRVTASLARASPVASRGGRGPSWRPMRPVLIAMALAGLLMSSAARAEVAVAATYAAYSHLLNVLNLEASLDLRPEGYALRVVTHTAGTVRVFFHSDIDTSVSGSFTGGAPRPARYASAGQIGGEPRNTVIEYQNGQPVVRTLTPPNAADERDDVPAGDTAGTVDTLSAMAFLIRQVTNTGRCDGSLTTFDGRRLAVLTARTGGQEVLDETGRSSFAGLALRCDFEGRQTGGFKQGDDLARQKRPQHGSAWFARAVPGGPAIPVRVTFENRILGEATLYLSSAAPR